MDRIPSVKRITHYGWIDDTHFCPGAADGFILDFEGTGRSTGIGGAKGDFELWKTTMQKFRHRAIFRFIFASAYAGPLLRPLGQRIYLVHNWIDSRGGKTAAMFAALSGWGDPEQMRVNFNATQVGLEKAAGFFCDLPMGVNERQLAGGKQDFVEQVVYILSEGSGKLRGSKQGGLQEQTTWRCVVLTSGEVPLAVGSTQTGVSTRALEIYGAPFADEEEASSIYNFTPKHHGHAGPEYIRHLVEYDQGKLEQLFTQIQTELNRATRGHSRSHVASVAVSCTADVLLSQWIFGADEKSAMRAALEMGEEILGILQTTEETDVNEKAYGHILDWVLANLDNFTDHYKTVRLGFLDRNEPGLDGKKQPIHHVYIFSTLLEKELTRSGFSYQKTMRWLESNNKITTRISGSRVRRTISRNVEGVTKDMVHLAMPSKSDISGFTVVEDDELPF
jgi:uncharacterized protein (DUF927 family)